MKSLNLKIRIGNLFGSLKGKDLDAMLKAIKIYKI